MSNSDKQRLILKFSALVVLIACLIFFLNKKTQALLGSVPQVPIVSVQAQQDAPLELSLPEGGFTSPLEPQINVVMKNISDKTISAYSIREDDTTEHAQSAYVTMSNMTSREEVLQPFQVKLETITGGTYSEPVKSITLSLDFVEFMDGTTWGPDTHKSVERLAGQRAGARAARDRYLQALKVGGLPSVAKAITSLPDDLAPPLNHTSEWNDGFITGRNVVRERLQRANNNGGLTRVEAELRKPFDALEGRQGQ